MSASAKADPAPDLTEDDKQEGKKQKKQDSVTQMTLTEWRRGTPVFLSVEGAMKELGYHKLSTNGEKNSCMIFAFMLCTGALEESEQRTR